MQAAEVHRGPVVRRYARNLVGRDFVVGDIHGEFGLLAKALQRVGFDPSKDRLFLLGDLIDRGRASHLCAYVLSLPYVHAVLGNHEHMLLQLYAKGEPHPDVLAFMMQRNGFGWWRTADADTRRRTLDAVSTLPLAIEIDTPRGSVGLVHADVSSGMSWQDFTRALEAGDERAIDDCVWGRKRIDHGDRRGVAGIDRLFVGHNKQKGVTRLGNVYFIDTGAAFWRDEGNRKGHLTLADLTCPSGSLTGPTAAGAIVEIRDAGNDDAFERYAT